MFNLCVKDKNILKLITENGRVKGSIVGVTTGTFVEKVWLTSQSVGNITFIFPFSLIVFEI